MQTWKKVNPTQDESDYFEDMQKTVDANEKLVKELKAI